MKTENKKRNTSDVQESNRNLIVEYLKSKKGTQGEAAIIFGLSLGGVHNIWAKYRKSGSKSLVSKKRGVKEGKKITKSQAKEVQKLIKDKMPEQLKLPYALWTREGVSLLMKNRFGINLSKWQVGRYLKQWGFTPQKPIVKAYEQKGELVKEWLQETYPKIKRSAAREGAEIYWEDETGMRSDHQTGTSYSPKGQTPIVKRTGKRFSINMISAISNRGSLNFMIIETGRFNSEVFLDFLKRLIKGKQKKTYLIVDGHPSHKTNKIKAWLNQNKKRIKLFYLPPYSPELNPDEYLNQDIKTNIVGKQRPINKSQLKLNVENFMNKRKEDKKQVQKYFHAKHVKYAA